ncbi:hypothetical protein AVEN_238761-1 [Araneus ventricosus]|uniref:Uncharacterized protein n=1 Tax=Araneus ventricosus TaxID=182803 RepID=A0A4Y2WB22_ARAVE|nr:hypothetical protein AVEN_238761-1 [Araneus ventricosus]
MDIPQFICRNLLTTTTLELPFPLPIPITIREVTLGYSFTNPLHNRITATFLTFCSTICHDLPISIFAIFYVLVCQHLSTLVKSFGKKIAIENPERLLSSYSSIKSTVASIDNELSVLVLLSVAINSFWMYVSLSAIINPDPRIDFPHRVVYFCSFISTLMSLSAVLISATFVSEASLEIAEKAEASFGNANTSKFLHLKFLMCVEKEISMTIWKMMPIRRGLILAVTGTIFTYVVIFKDL